ncbi:hypothetical protein FRC10_006257, partial [Ceratobasidium sp. 414]
MQDYLRNFQSFAAPLGCNDTILRDMFYDRLKDEVADQALEIDLHLEAFCPHVPVMTRRSTPIASSSTSTGTPTNQVQFINKDFVYMIGSDDCSVKGQITSIHKD